MNLNGFLSMSGNVSGSLGADLVVDVEANPSGVATQPLIKLRVGDVIYAIPSGGGGGGTSDYNLLTNKPKINGVILQDELSLHSLGIQEEITFSGEATEYLNGEGYFSTPPYISSYLDLSDKPLINGVVLTGNKTSDDLDLSNKAHVNELSGASVDFQNGQELPLIKCIANIEPVQSGSETPSPSNPRPINGSTDVTITVSNDDETKTYTAALGQTVYGGQLNVLTGELTIDRGFITITSESQLTTFTYNAENGSFSQVASDGKISNAEVMCISNMMEGIAFNNRAASAYVDKDRCYSDETGKIRIRNRSSVTINTKAELFARFQGAEICYFLATPQTVQLTPEKVRTLLGVNNISANTGDIDIIYINNVNDPAIEFILNNL